MKKIIRRLAAAVTAAAVTLTATVSDVPERSIAAENTQEQNDYPVEVIYANGETMFFDGSGDISLYLNGRSMDCTATINSDFELKEDFFIGPGINAVVEGNGHTITCTKSESYLILSNRGTVTFRNCEFLVTGEGINVPFHNENDMTLENCKITGNVATVDGVLIENTLTSTLTIDGGEIRTNDNADRSGECCILNLNQGPDNHAVLNILGGNIISNKASEYCIQNYGSLNVSGGTITGNGKYCIDNSGTLIMTDGQINGEVDNAYDAEVKISGGKLTAVKYCLWNYGTLDISNGVMEGVYPVTNNNSGILNISGGSFGAKDSGIKYIPNSGVLNLSGSPEFNNTALWLKTNDNIGITGEITYSDPCTVYVNSSLPRIITNGWDTHMTGKDPSDYFKSPYAYTKIVNRSDETVITYHTVTYNANGGICSAQSVYVNNYGKITDLAVPTREGCSFLGWFTEETGGEKIDTDTVFNDDTTVYAHWTFISGDAWTKDTENSTEPTINTDGYYTYTSDDYGTITVTVPKLSDTEVWTKDEEKSTDPTLTEKGEYVYTSEEYGEVTIEVPELSDEEVWTKDTKNSTEPTITEKGEYIYTSEEYGEVTIEVPELSDETVWEKDTENSMNPALTDKGEYVYKSEEYGEVTIEVPELSDDSVWTKDETESTEPAETEPGTYVYESEEYGKIEIEVPALNDTDVWTLDESQHVDPTEDQPGQDVYISEYGEVTVTIPPLEHTHTYSSEWTSDETNHWHAATCGHEARNEEAEHNFGSPQVTPSTCTKQGSEEYVCQTCGYTKTVPLNLAEHNFDGVWQKDEDDHWKVCTVCNTEKGNIAAHNWNDGEITKQPTTDETGEKTLTCTVCGMTKTEIIPAIGGTENPDPGNPDPDNPDPDNPDPDNPDPDNPDPDNPNPDNPDPDNPDPDNPDPDNPDPENPNPDDTDNGNISKEVQPGDNAPDTQLETPLDELIEAVLTPEEQALVDDGVDIKIVLTIEDGTDSVPAEDKEKAETAISGLSDCKIGQYLEVNLLKIIGDEQEQITETNAPITLIFAVPEALRGEGRTYSVIRVHDGEADVLSDLDSDINTVTIETDKFSTYALAYSEKTNVTPPDSGSPGVNFTVPDQSGSNGSDTAPTESDTTDGSGSAPTESKPADSGNTLPENGGSSDNGATSPGGEASSTDENGTNSDVGTASINDNNSMPSESAVTDNNDDNPSTGIAVSFIPLAATIAVLTAAVKRKKK